MKYGIRTPSLKKSIKARTTGKLKRQLKSAVNPLYGKKGMGIISDPQKAIYNKVYSKTSVSVGDAVRAVSTTHDATSQHSNSAYINTMQVKQPNLGDPKITDKRYKTNSVLFYLSAIIFAFLGLVTLPIGIIFLILAIAFFLLGRTASAIVKNRCK